MNLFQRFPVVSALLLSSTLWGCGDSKPEQVELPSNVFTLQDEVVAFRAKGAEGQASSQELSLEPLREAAGDFKEVFLLEYTAESVAPVEFRREGDSIVADLTGGSTYLLGAIPTGRLYQAYGILCFLEHQRTFIDRIQPDLFQRLCPLIFCPADMMPADSMYTEIPELAPLSDRMDFGDWRIGGWEPIGNLCERCTEWRPGLVLPSPICWEKDPVQLSCSNPIFQDNFESDAVGSAPSASPAGAPADDALELQSPSYIRVVNAGPIGSKAVRISRGASSGVVLGCVTGGGPHADGSYVFKFRAYRDLAGGDLEPPMTISVTSSSEQVGFQLVLQDQKYRLISGAGTEVLSATYASGVVDEVEVRIDLDAKQVTVDIDGTTVASNKPFVDSTLADLYKATFGFPQAILEAYGEYVVDDVSICKVSGSS